LDEASKAKVAEAEAQKTQGVAKKAKTLRQIEEGELRRASDALEQAEIESCVEGTLVTARKFF
jgi:hypothetical protein